MAFADQISAAFTPIAAVYDAPSTTRALTWAQSFIESYTDQQFDLVESDVVYLDPKPRRQALLPQVPVVNVDSVEAWLPQTTGGMAWTALTNYAVINDTGLIYDTTGMPGVAPCAGFTWPWMPGSLKITYDHGYSPVPQALVDVACRLAQQYLENPTGQLQRRAGDIEDRFGGSQGVVMNEFDRTILDSYRWVRIA